MSGISRTVIISCAGMGSRLGFGCTKALVEVEGKSLLARHLELLAGVEDVRVVVGYQSERVMEEARKYRSDVKFVFNHRSGSQGLCPDVGRRYIGTSPGYGEGIVMRP